MTFSSRELSVLAYANGFTLWHYRSGDSWTDLLAPAPGYFAAADELLRPGDQVLLTMTGTANPAGAMLIVADVRPGIAVEVAPAGWPLNIAGHHRPSCEAAAERRAAAAC